MNIFQLIKCGEDFSHLLNEKNILSTKKNKEIEYNPLTYCMEQENKEAFIEIVNYIKKQENKDTLFQNLSV